MKDTITDKLLSDHMVEGKLTGGGEIGLSIDQRPQRRQ